MIMLIMRVYVGWNLTYRDWVGWMNLSGAQGF